MNDYRYCKNDLCRNTLVPDLNTGAAGVGLLLLTS